MTGVLVTRKKTLSLYCEFLLAGSGFFNITPRACVTFQLLRCKGKIQLLMQDASGKITHSVFLQTQKANGQFWFERLFPSQCQFIAHKPGWFSFTCAHSFIHTLHCWPAQLWWEGENSAFQGAVKKKNYKNTSWYRLV